MKKILFIEDERMIVDLLKDILNSEKCQCEFLSVSTIRAGREVLKNQKIDLILLDLLLPDEYGLEFLKEIKQNKDKKNIPVIVFTNYTVQGEDKKAKNLGANDYLVKANLDPSEIVQEIKKYI